MSEIEKPESKTIIDKVRDIEESGLLHIKGYKNNEIASLLSISLSEVKENIEEYKKISNRQAEEDPYFL